MRLWPFPRRATSAAIEDRSFENPSVSLNDAAGIRNLFGVVASSSGVNVTVEKAVGIPAVLQAVRLISETVGTLPVSIVQGRGANAVAAADHPLDRILSLEPNPWMTAAQFYTTGLVFALLWGNLYIAIERNQAGRVTGLYLVEPWTMQPDLRSSTPSYIWQSRGGNQVRIPGENILHIAGLSLDPKRGLPLVSAARNSLGAGIAQIDFTGRFYANSATPPFVVETPIEMDEEQTAIMRRSLSEKATGLGNAFKMLFLPQGVTVKEMQMSLKDAQFNESARHVIGEVSRIFNVPPDMLFDLERATFNNIEHQSIRFGRHSVRPWVVKIEQEFERKLFDTGSGFRAEFDMEGILRGDFKSRAEGYNLGINAGWMTRNEARARESMPPLPGLDAPLVPLNMTGAPGDAPENDASEV